MTIRIDYIGAAWCAPCRTVKPIITVLAYKFVCPVFEYDYDELEEEEQATVSKLPTVRIWKDSTLQEEITTNHAETLENWLRSNVRVNTEEDF